MRHHSQGNEFALYESELYRIVKELKQLQFDGEALKQGHDLGQAQIKEQFNAKKYLAKQEYNQALSSAKSEQVKGQQRISTEFKVEMEEIENGKNHELRRAKEYYQHQCREVNARIDEQVEIHSKKVTEEKEKEIYYYDTLRTEIEREHMQQESEELNHYNTLRTEIKREKALQESKELRCYDTLRVECENALEESLGQALANHDLVKSKCECEIEGLIQEFSSKYDKQLEEDRNLYRDKVRDIRQALENHIKEEKQEIEQIVGRIDHQLRQEADELNKASSVYKSIERQLDLSNGIAEELSIGIQSVPAYPQPSFDTTGQARRVLETNSKKAEIGHRELLRLYINYKEERNKAIWLIILSVILTIVLILIALVVIPK